MNAWIRYVWVRNDDAINQKTQASAVTQKGGGVR